MGNLKFPWSMKDTVLNLKELKILMLERFFKKLGKRAVKEFCFDFDRAIAACEKQTPKKPYEGHYEKPGEKPYIKYSCPNKCGIQLSPVTERKLAHEHQYCPKCGQALDWSDVE